MSLFRLDCKYWRCSCAIRQVVVVFTVLLVKLFYIAERVLLFFRHVAHLNDSEGYCWYCPWLVCGWWQIIWIRTETWTRWRCIRSCYWSVHTSLASVQTKRKSVFDWQSIQKTEVHSSTETRREHEKWFRLKCWANSSSVNWDLPRKHRKCHGAAYNKVNVLHLQETNLWHMLCCHFKNALWKIMLNPPCLKHLGLENRKKCLQFCFQISVNVLHDGISVIYITVPRTLSLLATIYITIM